MEEDDKGCLMIRLGVSGCFFWYRPTRVVPEKTVKRLCVNFLHSQVALKQLPWKLSG